MIQMNTNYNNLKESYLFYNIAQKTKKYLESNTNFKLTMAVMLLELNN